MPLPPWSGPRYRSWRCPATTRPFDCCRCWCFPRPKVCNRLFAYPPQSNFSGVQHPLEWIDRAHAEGWDVLLDAAAFVPTNRLDLGRWHPDYVTISFYKMFGYPTGVGVLIARREAMEKLRRPWFGGGTITVASVQADKYFLAKGAQGFEDGTLNYACLPAVEQGLDFIDSIGIDTIHTRVTSLAGWLIEHMAGLTHGNGRPVVKIYGPTGMTMRGGTVAFNVYDARGASISHLLVEDRANTWNISLRTGCFCNPGAGELALGLSKGEMIQCLDHSGARMSLEEFRQCIDGKNTGAVRVSLGLVSNFEDVKTFLRFLNEFRET
jgi:selenocysteine lyase/cysteine desulfurase